MAQNKLSAGVWAVLLFGSVVGIHRVLDKGKGQMTESDAHSAGPDPHVNFDAPAVLRKWPSLNNQRLSDSNGPYMLVEDTLDKCIRAYMAKPESTRHLYEIQTASQPLVRESLSADHVVELARLREFL